MSFFFEVLIGGLLSGVMYSLVALGFVLIYKASGVFNFAQGAMVFFAALTYVGLLEVGLPPWPSVPVTTRPRSRWAFPCSRSGRWSGALQAASLWSRACCGEPATASSTR